MTIKAAFEKYAHLDKMLSCSVSEEHPYPHAVLRDLWLAIKDHMEECDRIRNIEPNVILVDALSIVKAGPDDVCREIAESALRQ